MSTLSVHYFDKKTNHAIDLPISVFKKPSNPSEYQELEHVLDSLIDEVRDEASHPLALVMKIIGDNLEQYDDETHPPLASKLDKALPSFSKTRRVPWLPHSNTAIPGGPMTFELPKLPYAQNALEPHISAETLGYHYGKHHQTYVTNLNNLIKGTEFENKSLEEIIKTASGGIFNNAAQVWNHTFYWNCLSPTGGKEPTGQLAALIAQHFGSFASFKEKMTQSALTNFGSGWTWLVQRKDGSLAVVNTGNAELPMSKGESALLTIDVWEHAYYVDYRNARAKYLEAIWNLIHWNFVASCLR